MSRPRRPSHPPTPKSRGRARERTGAGSRHEGGGHQDPPAASSPLPKAPRNGIAAARTRTGWFWPPPPPGTGGSRRRGGCRSPPARAGARAPGAAGRHRHCWDAAARRGLPRPAHSVPLPGRPPRDDSCPAGNLGNKSSSARQRLQPRAPATAPRHPGLCFRAGRAEVKCRAVRCPRPEGDVPRRWRGRGKPADWGAGAPTRGKSGRGRAGGLWEVGCICLGIPFHPRLRSGRFPPPGRRRERPLAPPISPQRGLRPHPGQHCQPIRARGGFGSRGAAGIGCSPGKAEVLFDVGAAPGTVELVWGGAEAVRAVLSDWRESRCGRNFSLWVSSWLLHRWLDPFFVHSTNMY